MVNISEHIVYFICDVCKKEVSRKCSFLDYLGKINNPENWTGYRCMSEFSHACDDENCKSILDAVFKTGIKNKQDDKVKCEK